MTDEVGDLLEALGKVKSECYGCRCEEKHHRDRKCWLCMECNGFRPQPWRAQYALAKKAHAQGEGKRVE